MSFHDVEDLDFKTASGVHQPERRPTFTQASLLVRLKLEQDDDAPGSVSTI